MRYWFARYRSLAHTEAYRIEQIDGIVKFMEHRTYGVRACHNHNRDLLLN